MLKPLWKVLKVAALAGIPPIGFSDGPRGVIVGHSTSFPVAMARAATWDHIQHIYNRIGVSTRAAAALWAIQNAVVS
jgi:beta-glucosidase-like glycosyl hydrolase